MRRTTIIARQSIYHAELTNKLVHMLRFIEQEGDEKADEIDCKTEEECNMLKGDILQNGRLKINKEFDNKEILCKRNNQITHGKEISKSQMLVINAKIIIFDEIGEEVKARVKRDMQCCKSRWNILRFLIIESLYKLLEKQVVIKCREIDEMVIEKSIQPLEEFYLEVTGKKIKIYMDDTYLPANALPGIIMRTPNNKISLKNTLDERVQQIMKSSLPVMNQILFGSSKMKK